MRLRSIELTCPSAGGAAEFMRDTWGLLDAGKRGATTFLRATHDHPHVMSITEGARKVVNAVTFSATPSELDALRARAVAAGGQVSAPVAAFDEPGGTGGFTVKGLENQTWRFVAEPKPVARVDDSHRPQVVSHVVLNSLDRGASTAFLEKMFGWRLSDRTKIMDFVRCDSTHHAIAFAENSFASLNHIAFEVTSLEEMMKNIGRMRDLGHQAVWGPGRHGPGNNAFAYFVAPFGQIVEYTAEVQRVDDSYKTGMPENWKWPPGRIDHWGLSSRDTAKMAAAESTFRFAG
ncbi:MAG: VOC family protein [Burkholderiales bacterium]